MKRAIQLNNALFGLFVVVSIFSFGASLLRGAVARQQFNSAKQDPNAAPPEQVLTVKDGFENTPENVQYYATVLDQLELKCTENRLQLAGMGAAIAKKNREWGFDSSSYDGLKTLLSEASYKASGEISCLNVSLDLMDG